MKLRLLAVVLLSLLLSSGADARTNRRGTIWEKVRLHGTGLFELREALERLSLGGTDAPDIVAFERALQKLRGGEPPKDPEILGLLLHLGFESQRVDARSARRGEIFVLLGAVAVSEASPAIRAWACFHRASLLTDETELFERELILTQELSLDGELTTRAVVSLMLSRLERGAPLPEPEVLERASEGGRGLLAAKEFAYAWDAARRGTPVDEVWVRVGTGRALLAARVNVSGKEPFADVLGRENSLVPLRWLSKLEPTPALRAEASFCDVLLTAEAGTELERTALFGCKEPAKKKLGR